jgi:hypothetical protein
MDAGIQGLLDKYCLEILNQNIEMQKKTKGGERHGTRPARIGYKALYEDINVNKIKEI